MTTTWPQLREFSPLVSSRVRGHLEEGDIMSIKPPKRPEQSEEAIRKLAADAGVTDEVFLVAIRGFFRDSMGKPGKNDFGLYDDGIWLCSPDKFISFNANTDPSVQRAGIAQLNPGVHSYKKGRHGISRGPGYPALRPNTKGERLPVTRDGKPSEGIAINIHKGGYHTTSSEGCQTLHPDQWTEFINTVYQEMDQAGQSKIPYVLTVKPNL